MTDKIELDGEMYEKIYGQFVIENYYDVNEPVTPEFFKEMWEEMSEAEKAQLAERATRKKT